MSNSNLKEAWLSLAPNALQPAIETQFIIPAVLPLFGFNLDEVYQNCPTGKGADNVDIAVRKNTEDNIFAHTAKEPSLIIEIKNRLLDLNSKTNEYKKAVRQVKRYLHPAATNCQKVKWAILTNANHIQLFRRHGKVVSLSLHH